MVFLPQHSLNWTTQISDAVTSYTVQHNKHTAYTILWIWESITTSCNCSPTRQVLEPSLKRHHQFTEQTAGTWTTQGHIQSHGLEEVRVWAGLELREYGRGDLDGRERCWEGFSL